MTLTMTTARDHAFQLDAAVTAANGLAYLVGADVLDSALGLSPTLLRSLGAFFVGYAVLVWFAEGATLRRELVVGNGLWVVASVAVAVTGAFSPTTAGTVWILVQAAVVAGLAVLQGRSLRR